MAKDAKGHGSEKRSANSVDTVYSSKAGVGGLGKGMYARLHSGQQLKLNPAATDGRVPSVGMVLNPADHTPVPAHQGGVVAAVGPKIALDAKASTFHPESNSWDIQNRSYNYNGANRKAAITFGLNKIQSEFPNHKEHSVEIRD
jgi:hypothetical protein